MLAHLLSDVLKEGLDEFRLTAEAFPQDWILCCHAHRAGIEMADPHHDAAAHDERCSREAEFLRPEEGGDDDVTARLELAVSLNDNPVAQAVDHEGLLGLGQAELPWGASMLERGQRRGASTAVVAGDEDDIGVRLCDARRDGADPNLGHQLHVDSSPRVGILQVVNELCEVLDRVDVMVRWRRDEPDTGGRVPGLRDPRVDLVARQLPALARLRTLGHLDLDVVGIDEVLARHPEASGRNLLDGRALRITVRHRDEALGILATLPRVRLRSEPVHRDRQRLVRFRGDRPIGHRTG